jgi:hypothetical protein
MKTKQKVFLKQTQGVLLQSFPKFDFLISRLEVSDICKCKSCNKYIFRTKKLGTLVLEDLGSNILIESSDFSKQKIVDTFKHSLQYDASIIGELQFVNIQRKTMSYDAVSI